MRIAQPPSAQLHAMLLRIVQLGAVSGSLYVAWNLWVNAPPMRIAVVLGAFLCAWAMYSIFQRGDD